jgi:hypothetical protein
MLGDRPVYAPSGYSLEKFSPTGNAVPGDGLVTLIRHDIPHVELQLNTNLQATAFRIGTNRPTTICNSYFSPNENPNVNDIQILIDQLPPPYIMLGDFNSKSTIWGNDTTDRPGQVIENLLLNQNVCILNTGQHTHYHQQTGSSSAIDLTLCSPLLLTNLEWKVLPDTYGSDHFPITIDDTDNTPVTKEPRYILKKANWTHFRDATEVSLTEDQIENLTVDEMVDNITIAITTAANLSIPMSSSRILPKRVCWWTPECTRVNIERKQALRRHQRTRLVADKITYSRRRAIARSKKNIIRKDSWKAFVSTLNVDTPMRKIWSRTGKMYGKYKQRTAPYLIHGNNTVTEPAAVANTLAQHYERISGRANYSPESIREMERSKSIRLDFKENEAQEYNTPISIREISGMLKQCKNSAPGEDQVQYQMLDNIHASLLTFIQILFNRIFLNHCYPDSWRLAIILSFLKPNKPSTSPTSYRPIALTSCIGKLMEKVINVRLVSTLEANNILSPVQYGFRRLHSTIDSLTRITTDITTAFTRKEQTACVFFDMEKAYDTTWKFGIVEKLHKSGIRGNLAKYIINFLKNRRFKTKIETSTSEECVQEEGVPQGSVLSCTLFALAINDITTVMPQDIKCSLYVDDFVIYSSSNYVPALERRMQRAINNATKWATNHGFKFSISKTNAINFHRKRGIPPEPSLTLYGQPIPFKPTEKFLGILFDTKMTWKPHIQSLKKNCMHKLNLLKSIAHTNWGADRTTMLRLYRATILPKLDYGSTIYSSAKDHIIATLDPVHNAAIRISIGAFKSTPVISLYAESGEPPLSTRRQQLMLQYLARSKQLPGSPTQTSITQSSISNIPGTLGTTTSLIIEQLNFPDMDILPVYHNEIPIWQISQTTFCKGMTCPKKDNILPRNLKRIFLDHVANEHANQTYIYTDGSKDGNRVGCAAVSSDIKISR